MFTIKAKIKKKYLILNCDHGDTDTPCISYLGRLMAKFCIIQIIIATLYR